MKYLKLYESFINESTSGKKLILFSGPSASGKTYLATDAKSALAKKFKHWYSDLEATAILIGTDTFMDPKNLPALYTLMENYGLKKYTEIAKEFPDNPWLIEVFDKKLYKKFRSEALAAELKIWDKMNAQVGYNKTKCTGSIRNKEDGRVCGMAWVAYMHPAQTIIFDDIDTAIKNYFNDLVDILCFTPFNYYLSNIKKRIDSPNTSMQIDVSNTNAGIYQYIKWFKSVENPELDNKFYTIESAKKLLEKTGYKDSNKILKLLGVNLKDKGFYIGKNTTVNCDQVINTRDEASVGSVNL
jgi:hypothetical protein